uniref:7TM_GPCR_Srx domain-containing protein n=1 Tax=Steinernema glaseri TaxID=37863 RepID=A0A1I8ABR3_9BILA
MVLKISKKSTIQQLYYHRVVIAGTLFIQLLVDGLYGLQDLPVTLSNCITIIIVYVMVRRTDEMHLGVIKHQYLKDRVKGLGRIFTLTVLSTLRIALSSFLRDARCEHDINNYTCAGALLSLFISYVVMMLAFSDNWLMLCFFNYNEPVVVQRPIYYMEAAPAG